VQEKVHRNKTKTAKEYFIEGVYGTQRTGIADGREFHILPPGTLRGVLIKLNVKA
jgi:hypothetical protein